MKKKLLLLILPFLSVGLTAQNNCSTCHQGTKGTMLDSATSAHMPHSRVGNGNSSLGQSYVNQNVCGLNYTQASILTETRSSIYAFNANGSGFPCTLNISALPCGGNSNILKAYVYYEASYTEANPPSTSVVFTNPVPTTNTIAATMIGQAGPKCWGETGTAAYRADVTADISGNGNYGVNLTGFNNAGYEVDGVSLVIIYKDPNATYSGSISLWDGDIVEWYVLGAKTYSGINVCATSATASAFGVYGDIQSNVNGNINTDVFNGTSGTFANIFWNFNVVNTTATAGQTTCVFNSYTNNGGDCYAWILAGYYWQNTTCQVCTPTSTMTLTTTSIVNPTCGSNNGSATISVTGGTAPYTYLWNPGGQTNATATGLSAGTYTVTVTSSGGCSTTTAVVTLVSSALSVAANVTAEDKCNGDCNGSATAVITGGTAPFTYSWAPSGATNATATGLCAGNYTVTVHDINGCTGTAAVTITQPPALSASATVVNDKCNGGNNGSSTVTVSGGTAPYTYFWAPGGQTSATATGLTVGSYTVTITDNNGCQTQVTVNITQPPPINITLLSITGVNCNGGNNGSISITASGGNVPYTYLWSPIGGTNATGTGLTVGTYTITVTDNNGCSQTASYTVNQPTPVVAVASVLTNVKCNGGNTGSATVAAGGGTAPYTYLWTPTGGTGVTAGGLTAGTYTVTVTDNHGCTGTATVTITQPPPLTATTSFTQATCNNANGTATVAAGGGTPAYTYLWSPGNQTNITATGLLAGTYTVTVTDNNGCTTTATVTVTQPTPVTATITASTGVNCFGSNNGTATVSAGGGTAPYNYLWSPSGGTNATGTGMSAGTYTVTVTDANGCTSTATVTITTPTAVTATMGVPTGVLCNGGNNGSATVTAGGGTPGYSYIWTPNGGTNATGTGLTAGTYTVTITDSHGCTATASVTITQPPLLTASITASTGVQCNGQSNGSATVTAGGGTLPYAYNWNPGGNSNATATGLSAGNYTVTVTDRNGCQASAIVTITTPNPLTTTTSFIQASCNLANGSATVVVNGGTVPYTYLWNPGGQTNATATGLAAGTYTVNITDNNGCTTFATVTVTQPSAVNAAISASTGVSCNGGNDGTATAIAVGGSGPYTYVWSPAGGTNVTGTGMSAGNYTVTVTDNNGCQTSAFVTITQPSPVTASIIASTNDLCNGGNNGNATVLAGGGTPNYTYTWSPAGGNGVTGTGLTAGTYTVTVTDANGCTATTSVTIAEPPLLTVNVVSTTGVSCNGGNDGSATVVGGGGTPAYTYLWSPAGGTNTSASGLIAGNYTVTITDANGCTGTTLVTITQPAVLTATASFTQATCNLSNGSATVVPVGGTGPYNYLWSPVGGTNATATGISANSYTVVVTDNNGCTTTATVTVTQPSAVAATITGSTGVSCFGGNDGTATVSANGGTVPYTYLWNPAGGTNATGTGMSMGNYTVTVTDNNGCISTAAVTITQPTLLTATITATTNVSCNGGNNGSSIVTAAGGTLNYTYAWLPNGGNSATGTGLTAGTYTVTVTDANGCTATTSVTIAQPPLLTALITATTNVSCFTGSNGASTVTAGGGTLPYTYLWTPNGGNSAIGTGLTAGGYTVTVADLNGCTATASVIITQPPLLTASINASTNVNCFGGNNGTATVTSGGGTIPYTYAWSPTGGTNVTGTGLIAGSYTVTVTDNNGCSATATIIITQPTALSVSISGQANVSCFGGNNGTATSVASGGTSPYGYLWTPAGGTNPTGTGLSAGLYTVTVTDANGCTAQNTITITQPNLLAATTTVNTNVSCTGGNNGSATANVTGGTSQFSYIWTPAGGTNATGTGMAVGTYTVTVTDANGCTATATATISQPTVLSVTIGNVFNVLCNGAADGNATATGAGGTSPYNYSWAPGGGTNAQGTGLSAGTYNMTVTDANGCNATTSVTITQPPVLGTALTATNISCFNGNNGAIVSATTGGTTPYTYAWSNGQTTVNASVLTSGIYTLVVTDADGCTTSATVTLTEPTQLAVTANGPQSVCSGAPANLFANATGGTPPYNYNWTPAGGTSSSTTTNPLVTTTYTVTVTDANGCIAKTTLVVNVDPALALAIAGNTAVCPGGTISLTATASGGDGLYNFLWVPSNSTMQTVTFSPKNDTMVTIELTDGCGSTMLTTNIPVTVDPLPKISFSSDIMAGCVPLCIQFRNMTTLPSGGISQWGWSFGNGDSSKQVSPVFCYKDTGRFSVSLTATSDSGCSSTLNIVNMVRVYPPPAAGFTYSPNPINIMSPQIQFTDQSTGVYPISEWYWTFGQGDSSSMLRNPTHTYTDTGTFCARLIVVDIHGCVDSITDCFVVDPLFTFYIPDAFTPNGDGINDVFMPKGSYVKSFEMYVYDRWGMQLFHSTDIRNGWDGTVKGSNTVSQEDTYVYLINVTDSEGNLHNYTGKVNLVK